MKRKPEIFRDALDHLYHLCGGNNSESDTEAFHLTLLDVLKDAELQRKQSHRDGLCLDMISVIAFELQERYSQSQN